MHPAPSPDWTTLIKQAERTGQTSSALPASCYVDEDIAAQEIDALFRHGWFAAGRADMVKAAGDFIALDVAGQAIILLRDREGGLRAFANACRHRGARLVDGQGECKGLRCPFHSWMFHLDGRLAAAPHMEEAEGFDKAEHGLHAYRVEERLGFVFLCLDPTAPDLDAQLGGFAGLHDDWPLYGLTSVRRREMVVECNWKAFLEVFNEYYHLPFVHPDSIDDIYQRPDARDAVDGDFASQFGATDGTGGLLQTEQDKALPAMDGLKGQATRGVRYTWVFPNMSFAASSDTMWMYEAYPLAPNRCNVVQTACFPTETLSLPGADAKLAAYLERLDAAIDEDIPALENHQRGLDCVDAAPTVLHPLLEANVGRFAAWYAGRMQAAD